jgi:2-polyprenyl-3-methyl-5-hydroxy-6-metoxy-1,4-benzoquinol methylase
MTSITELMQGLRKRVQDECTIKPLDALPIFIPGTANLDRDNERKAGDLRDSDHLRYLNFNHAKVLNFNPSNITSHRTGFIGRLVVALKRRVMIWLNDLLKDHQQQEVDYRAHLVRYLNQVSAHSDARDAALFWELIHKIDTDVTNAVRRIESIHTEGEALRLQSEERLRELIYAELSTIREQRSNHQSRLETVERVTQGLERILATSAAAATGTVTAVESTSSPRRSKTSKKNAPETLPSDPSYLLLENRFRGSEEEIQTRVTRYASELEKSGPVFEIGSGRGELLEVLEARGVACSGIDMNQAMVERCKLKKLPVVFGDGIAYLEKSDDASIGSVIAIQVVEHLTQPQLELLIKLCSKKVKPGGKIIFETINPRSVVALSSNYFRDPTHVWPLHPDTLSYQMQLGGLEVERVDYLSPFPAESALALLPIDEFLSPKWQGAYRHLNQQLMRLNDLLYGFQDYCVIATVGACSTKDSN